MALSGVIASRRARAWIALACIGLMLIAVNIIAGRFLTARLDLTGERLYTLSRGTRQTLARIDEPITLRLYYSTRLGDSVPAYGVYAQRVRELLDEYVAAAKGKLRLEIHNPQPFSDVEDRAVAFGLQAEGDGAVLDIRERLRVVDFEAQFALGGRDIFVEQFAHPLGVDAIGWNRIAEPGR